LSTTYEVQPGDNYDRIARRVYGSEEFDYLIAASNPGAQEPLVSGTILYTPEAPDSPRSAINPAASDAPNEVALLLDKQRFRFWTQITITRSADTLDQIEFTAPFDYRSSTFKKAFRPFSYKPIQVTVGGSALFQGTMISVRPSITPNSKTVSIEGYATPGVLNDCNPPASSYPLEFNDSNLQSIASKLAEDFGIKAVFAASPGANFDRVAVDPNKRVLAFLSEMARQRNLIISSTPRGALLFQKSVSPGAPVARLSQGQAPLVEVSPQFNAQSFYSHITGIEPVLVGLAGAQYTVKNPAVTSTARPFTFIVHDTTQADIKTAVEAKASRMLANVASYTVSLATWRDPQGQLWEPNTTIKLLAPDAMVYTEYEFIIRSVQFTRTSTSETAKLVLVLPGAFSGEFPAELPWDA
jgi:prophage tail gpP-like protein